MIRRCLAALRRLWPFWLLSMYERDLVLRARRKPHITFSCVDHASAELLSCIGALDRLAEAARKAGAVSLPAPDCTYMVRHHCPVDGAMEIEAGAPCNWCGKVEPAVPMPAVFRSNRRAA